MSSWLTCTPRATLPCREPDRPGHRRSLCLAAGQARVVDLTSQLGLAISTVSKHLACLRECGLVEVRPAGRASVYSLAPPAERGLDRLLAAAEDLLAATGDAVVLCPAYGRRG